MSERKVYFVECYFPAMAGWYTAGQPNVLHSVSATMRAKYFALKPERSGGPVWSDGIYEAVEYGSESQAESVAKMVEEAWQKSGQNIKAFVICQVIDEPELAFGEPFHSDAA